MSISIIIILLFSIISCGTLNEKKINYGAPPIIDNDLVAMKYVNMRADKSPQLYGLIPKYEVRGPYKKVLKTKGNSVAGYAYYVDIKQQGPGGYTDKSLLLFRNNKLIAIYNYTQGIGWTEDEGADTSRYYLSEKDVKKKKKKKKKKSPTHKNGEN
jgi:hypothetical protein